MVSKICVSSEVKQIDDASFFRRWGDFHPALDISHLIVTERSQSRMVLLYFGFFVGKRFQKILRFTDCFESFTLPLAFHMKACYEFLLLSLFYFGDTACAVSAFLPPGGRELLPRLREDDKRIFRFFFRSVSSYRHLDPRLPDLSPPPFALFVESDTTAYGSVRFPFSHLLFRVLGVFISARPLPSRRQVVVTSVEEGSLALDVFHLETVQVGNRSGDDDFAPEILPSPLLYSPR